MPTFPIRETTPATPRAHILRLDLLGQPFPYRAGQAAFIKPRGAEKRRPYSIASAPEETEKSGLIEFLVQTSGDGTSEYAADLLQPGTPVEVDGPLGSFTFPEHPVEHHFAFIAGGTGIAPLRSMLWHTLLAERAGRRSLIYSVRSPEEFAYMQEFQRLTEEKRIEFRHTVTRTASEGWPGRLGRIDATYLKDLIVPGETLCFVCGPPALVAELPTQLKELGVREDQIKMERWT